MCMLPNFVSKSYDDPNLFLCVSSIPQKLLRMFPETLISHAFICLIPNIKNLKYP